MQKQHSGSGLCLKVWSIVSFLMAVGAAVLFILSLVPAVIAAMRIKLKRYVRQWEPIDEAWWRIEAFIYRHSILQTWLILFRRLMVAYVVLGLFSLVTGLHLPAASGK